MRFSSINSLVCWFCTGALGLVLWQFTLRLTCKCVDLCDYNLNVEPVLRSEDSVLSWIKKLYTPVSLSVPEMEGIYATLRGCRGGGGGGVLFWGCTSGGVYVPCIKLLACQVRVTIGNSGLWFCVLWHLSSTDLVINSNFLKFYTGALGSFNTQQLIQGSGRGLADYKQSTTRRFEQTATTKNTCNLHVQQNKFPSPMTVLAD